MKRFTPEDFPWTLDGLKDCIAYNKMKSKLICSTSKAAIVHVDNYEDSVALGAMSDWCISQHRESWHQYVVKDKNVQIFIYNFSKKPEADDSMVGATFTTEGKKAKLICSFVRPNYPICELFKTDDDKTALYNHVMAKLFGDFETNFDNAICKIKEYKEPKRVPVAASTTSAKAETAMQKSSIEEPRCWSQVMPYTWDDDDYAWLVDNLFGH